MLSYIVGLRWWYNESAAASQGRTLGGEQTEAEWLLEGGSWAEGQRGRTAQQNFH